jgi:hypothetical protein
MDRKKVIRALRFCIIGLVLLTIILFTLGLYTLINGLASAISGEETIGLNLNIDNSTGDWMLTVNANPRNTGVLGEKIFLQLGLLNSDGEYITKNSTSIYIEPGRQKSFSLVLTIPYEEVQRYNLSTEQGANVFFEMKFGISTLWDLVGLTQVMKIGGQVSL